MKKRSRYKMIESTISEKIKGRKSVFIVFLLSVIFIGCDTNTKKESSKLSTYLPVINKLSNQGKWKDAIDIATVNLQSDNQLTEKDKIGLYLTLGENYRFLEEYELAEENFEKVIALSKSIEAPNYLGEAYYGLGDLNYLKWNYFKQEEALAISENLLDSAMTHAKTGNNQSLESKILYRKGTIFQIQGNHEMSKKSFEKGLELSFSNSDTVGIIRNEIHKAAELETIGILDSALFHYTRAYDYAKQINRKYAETHSLCNLGLFYYDRGDFLKAKDYFYRAKILSEELNHNIVLCRSYYGLSIIEEKIGDKTKAIEFANKGLTLATEKGYKNYEFTFSNLIEKLSE